MNIKNKWVYINANLDFYFRFFHVKQVSDGYLECDKYIQFVGVNIGEMTRLAESSSKEGLITPSVMMGRPCAHIVNLYTYIPINNKIISEVFDFEAAVTELWSMDFQRKEEPKKGWW